MEYWALPPEVNSARIYSGPGSGPITAAASAWSALAGELKSAALAYQSIISQLTSEEWLGPASAALVAAVTPYVAWMDRTAEQAAQAAGQARAAAAAYETAHALTVPPVAVTANRVQLHQLVATNILGQNTAAIAGTEIEHSEMWVQDAVAMQGYHTQSTAAATLGEFSPPPNTTNPGGELAQSAAVGQASANAAGTKAASGTMQGLVNSLTAPPAEATTATTGAEAILKDPNVMLGEKGLNQAISSTNLGANNLCAVWRGLSGITGAQKLMGDFAKDAAKAAEGAAKGAAGAAAQGAAGAAGAAGGLGGVTGGMGGAGSLGALSVPPSWAPPAPPVSALGPVSGGSWQPIGPGMLGSAPMAPPSGMPGMIGAPGAGAAGAGFRGFGAPRYGVPLTVMPRMPVGG